MTTIEFRMIEIVKDACTREHLLTRRKHTHTIAHTPRQEQEIRQALRAPKNLSRQRRVPRNRRLPSLSVCL